MHPFLRIMRGRIIAVSGFVRVGRPRGILRPIVWGRAVLHMASASSLDLIAALRRVLRVFLPYRDGFATRLVELADGSVWFRSPGLFRPGFRLRGEKARGKQRSHFWE